MNRRLLSFLLICILWLPAFPGQNFVAAQIAPGYYAIRFSGKPGNQYSLERPQEFLSARAVERRIRLHIPPDSSDLPVTGFYLDSLRNIGLSVVCTSRWFNLAVVATTDTVLIHKAMQLPFVASVRKEERVSIPQKALRNKWTQESFSEALSPLSQSDYGVAYTQIHLHKGDTLHTLGYLGRGIRIAVLDAGFYHADTLPAFRSLYENHRILGTRDFVAPGTAVYEDHPHGMQVLSIMAGNLPGEYIGTAPEASYYLLRTENTAGEYIVEEYYWTAGAEFADSAGADIIHASLGYTVFDDPAQNHTYNDMNGKTTLVSRAASMAAKKGMMVVISAGNEGNTSWKYISAPADTDSILAVGAITTTGSLASFSSRGPSSDGRIKPDVVAMGVGTFVQNTGGSFSPGNGTSFASPVITGLTASLWQAEPSLSPAELRTAILMSGSQANSPDTLKGYGVPDFSRALQIARQMVRMKTDSGKISLFPNPVQDNLNVAVFFEPTGEITIDIFNISGALVWKTAHREYPSAPIILPLNIRQLNPGVYLLRYSDATHRTTLRFIKQ
ncbi:MAG: S8 family serine peptidase [Bacteroidales bacterium]|nr:S8 family serine peptidase [Bacteroidales bacterium]